MKKSNLNEVSLKSSYIHFYNHSFTALLYTLMEEKAQSSHDTSDTYC